jgi:hypothetical protein
VKRPIDPTTNKQTNKDTPPKTSENARRISFLLLKKPSFISFGWVSANNILFTNTEREQQ